MSNLDGHSPTGSLVGRVALITGAASGIGLAMTRLFAAEGAAVAAVDLERTEVRSVAADLRAEGRQALGIAADVTVADQCEAAIAETVGAFEKLDILCNNAGLILRSSMLDTSETEWDRLIDANLKSVFLMSRAAVLVMAEAGGGVILNTASGWGLTGGPQAAAYCASKGAVVQLTRAMAIDHGPQNIRVNCICPGDTDTPMLREEARQLRHDTKSLLAQAADRPLGRVGTPEEIGRAALFLVGDRASFVTGAAVVVDGGGLAGS